MTSYLNISQNLNLTSFQNLLNSANTTTDGTFWTGIYWMFIVIVFILSMAFGFEVAVILSMFAGMTVGMFLLYLGLINSITFGVSIATLLFMVVYLIYTSNKN